MGFGHQHEIHKRRFGRNLGVALVLVAFVALLMGLTMVKISSGDLSPNAVQESN